MLLLTVLKHHQEPKAQSPKEGVLFVTVLKHHRTGCRMSSTWDRRPVAGAWFLKPVVELQARHRRDFQVKRSACWDAKMLSVDVPF